jgi:two-component system, NarL family, sensor histidine kinase NreB
MPGRKKNLILPSGNKPSHPILEKVNISAAVEATTSIAITDQNGTILYANERFCCLTGFPIEELTGKKISMFNSGFHSKEFFQELWQAVLKGKTWEGDICNRNKQGEYFWTRQTVLPYWDSPEGKYYFAILAQDITRVKQMEEALKSLPRSMIEAQELERERLSRELHDDLGQSLATFKMLVQSTMNTEEIPSATRTRCLDVIIHDLNAIIEKSRHFSALLRPATLEILGLTNSLRALTNDFKNQRGLKVKSRIGFMDNVVFLGESIHLYRILQEALSNIIHHAQASRIMVSFHKGPETLTLTIRDDGRGFDRTTQARKRASLYGLGLTTMQERARLLHGDFSLASRPGRGTLIRVRVPVRYKPLEAR